MSRRWRRIITFSLLAFIGYEALVGLTPSGATTAPRQCELGDSSVANVTIRSCFFHLSDSDAGNTNYYLIVELSYTASQPIDAVRFAINAGTGKKYQIDRQHVSAHQVVNRTFQLISPGSTIDRVTVSADESS